MRQRHGLCLLIALLLCLMPQLVQAAEQISDTITVPVTVSVEMPDSDELFSAYVDRELYRPIYGDVSFFGTLGYDRLRNESERQLYLLLKAGIEEIACGRRASSEFLFANPADTFGCAFSYTAADLGNVTIVQDGKFTNEAKQAFLAKVSEDMDYRAVLKALLNDCPYDLYWFHKAHQEGGLVFRATMAYASKRMYLSKCTFLFRAAEPYGSGYALDTACTGATAAAAENARAIVEKYSHLTDREKLEAYREEICRLAAYNAMAAAGSSGSYGDPWQLIWVFDGDAATNVVCEGYAKAFQYLCDLSVFTGQVSCISVTGQMTTGSNSASHMWNIVEIDGVNYLVDVTNSDAGTAGAAGGLFLVNNPEGNWQTHYRFTAGNRSVTYAYDEDMQAFWGQEALELLHVHIPGQPVRENELFASCTQEGCYEMVGYCEECGNELSRTPLTIPGLAMHQDENGDHCCDECAAAVVTVTFHDGIGAGGTLKRHYAAGQPVALPECSFAAPDGRAFLGWGLTPGGVEVAGDFVAARDINLYALWEGLQMTATPPATGDRGWVVFWQMLWLCAAAGLGLLIDAKRRRTAKR